MEYKTEIWKSQKLGKEIAFDTETTIAPFHTDLHEYVIGQAYDGRGTVYIVRPKDVRRFFNMHGSATFIMQNAPFDLDVIKPFLGANRIYELIDENKIRDTKLLYKLYHLAVMGYVPKKSSLDHIAEQLLNIKVDKDADIRCTFGQYKGQPIENIPKEWMDYAAKDAVVTFDLYCTLQAIIAPHDSRNRLLSHHICAKGDYALNRIYKNGIGFDLSRRDDWLNNVNITLDHLQQKLATYGWVRGAPGIKNSYENIMKFLGLESQLPRSESGLLSAKAKDLAKFKNMPFVKEYLEFIDLDKTTSFVREINSQVLNPRYNSLLNTGRTSCSKPNIQQLPRAGDIRGMFIPKTPGNVFVDIDYSAIELSTLAQVTTNMFGYSVMGEMINAGKDLHTFAASRIFDKSEETVSKDQRQFAKILNFGLGANMSARTFVDYAAGFGKVINEKESQELKDKWIDVFPEMAEYFNAPRYNQDPLNDGLFTHYTLTGRKRAACTYTAFLNTGFQGLAADGLKLALYETTKQGYHVAAEVHDQILLEEKKDKSEETLREVSAIMVEQMKTVVPDIAVRTEGQIVERFCK